MFFLSSYATRMVSCPRNYFCRLNLCCLFPAGILMP
ncbi:hypothetical protein Gotri_001806 [Gossypium trilobum]|uniref:Uncharacterized protein n=1 Tax=Gossypium trilobum TaxID=34281 RepID=A0A7J9FGX7_9ROSI|nr:hypothetical protein [Gossypium trilobum]